jgi:hypothetical protein
MRDGNGFRKGTVTLYPVSKRKKYRIHVSCKEWGEETLYAARKGHVLLYPARKETGTPGLSPEGRAKTLVSFCEEGGQESLYPVRKGERNPCFL